MKKYRVAVVGAGLVGRKMVEILYERNFPMNKLKVLARTSRMVTIGGIAYPVEATTPSSFNGVDIALFAGTEGEKGAARMFADAAVRRGAMVIDNGKDFRLDPSVPLVVPEVNGAAVTQHQGIIANPNCSTAQLVHALAPIHQLSPLQRVIVTTFQSISGAGSGAMEEFQNQVQAWSAGRELPPLHHIPGQLAGNVLAGCFPLLENGFQDEEWKLVDESRKILDLPDLPVSATCVRVPVLVGHAESVYVETLGRVTATEARAALRRFPGIRVMDDPLPNGRQNYPTPLDAAGQSNTLVGRIREDPLSATGLWLWVVADNLRKGAAQNAVQIAEEVIARGCLGRRA